MDCLSQTYTKKRSFTTGQILQALSILRIWVTSLFIIFFIESIHTSVFLNDLLLCLCFALISHRSLFRDDGDGMRRQFSLPVATEFCFCHFFGRKKIRRIFCFGSNNNFSLRSTIPTKYILAKRFNLRNPTTTHTSSYNVLQYVP